MEHSLKKSGQRGYVLFTMAAALIGITGFAGLVVDLGYGEYVRRCAQAAADAGAKAASLEILAGSTDSITAAAKQDTQNNGFTDGANSVTVTVNHPPTSGSYSGNSKYAEVIVAKTFNTTFMTIFGVPTMTVRARGVGGGGGSGNCIYALAGTDTGLTSSVQDSLLASGGSTQVVAECGIVDESTNSKGLEATGGACISGDSVGVVGNYNPSPWSNCTGYVGAPSTGITSPGDPLKNTYTAPTAGSCTYTNWRNSGTTLSPGTYCGGIVISSSGVTVTASAGTYILLGGGLTVSGGANLSGTGVTFFNTFDASHAYKQISVTGGSATQLSAPTSGDYEGLLFWQDPTLGSTNWNKQNTVSGGSTSMFQGIMYFPDSPLVYSGGSSLTSGYSIIIADKVTFSGSSRLNDDYSSLSGGDPIKTTAILAE